MGSPPAPASAAVAVLWCPDRFAKPTRFRAQRQGYAWLEGSQRSRSSCKNSDDLSKTCNRGPRSLLLRDFPPPSLICQTWQARARRSQGSAVGALQSEASQSSSAWIPVLQSMSILDVESLRHGVAWEFFGLHQAELGSCCSSNRPP